MSEQRRARVLTPRTTRGASRLAIFVALLLAGCPKFHADKLPGTPPDATFVEVGGVQVRYREAGMGPPVVLLHGYGASSDSWLPVMPALAKAHRVIAIDLKGFGWTTRPEGDYSPAAQASLVWGVLDKLQVKDIAIVGHSWGSSVALAMAVARPERTRRVALYAAYVYDDQVPSFFRWAEKPALGELLFGLFYKERIEDRAALAYYDERWVTQARVDRVEAELDRPGTVAAALAVARRHQFGKLHDALRTFARPVLLLWGENDQVTPLRFGQRLARELADAKLVTYPRCGHIPMVEAHAPSTRDLTAFLGEDRARPPSGEPTPPSGEQTPPSGEQTPASGEQTPPSGEQTPSSGRQTPSPDQHNPFGPGETRGGGGGGGSGGGSGGGGDTLAAVELAEIEMARRLEPPSVVPDQRLPVGTDLAELGTELTPRRYAAPRDKLELVVHGGLRVREAGLFNLDLDRGLDSRGQPVFPVPLGGGQKLDTGDLRARTDLAAYARGIGVAVKARIDWLDNVALGADPELSNGSPATSSGQRPVVAVVKRVWGEALTPIGTLAAGRMGAHFGLGMSAHGGDCEDCDHGNAADRVAFVSPLAGHVVAVAYDFTARGPFTRSRDGGRSISLEPSDNVSGPTIALLKVHSPAARTRRAEAGRTSVEYGAYVSRRTQDRDVPASYLPTATPVEMFGEDDLVARGFAATAAGGWLRTSGAAYRVELEVAYARARIEQPSLIPGAEITTPITSSQLGMAVETEATLGPARFGLDGGFASGDDAPGFGAFPKPGESAPMGGAFDGPQANPPRDRTVDNFRFHPDYHVDQILFREIIGTVTDAAYVRPHARVAVWPVGSGHFELGAAVIASWAMKPTSTPSGKRALGVELDPELRYASRDGFAVTLAAGFLFPGAAFDNTELEARPAQVVRARVAFVF